MKKASYLIICVFILSSCSTSKNYLEKTDKDKALQDAVKSLNKNSANESTLQAIPILYSDVQQAHLKKITLLGQKKDLSSLNSIIYEYHALQNAYYMLMGSNEAYKIIKPQDYNGKLLEVKIAAAGQYYQLAQTLLEKPGRNNAKKAFDYFKICDNYIPGYKDVTSQISQAYDRLVINVVIDSLRDNAFFLKSSWGKAGYDLSNEYFQQKLITDLQNTLIRGDYPARFYTQEDARKNNIRVDWVVNLKLVKINIPVVRTVSSTTRSATEVFASASARSNDAVTGYVPDQPIYNTATAFITSSQSSISVRAVLEVNVRDAATGKNVSSKAVKEKYEWFHDEYGYTGDSRAGIGTNLSLYSSNVYSGTPQMREIIAKLYSKIYSQIKDNISVALNLTVI